MRKVGDGRVVWGSVYFWYLSEHFQGAYEASQVAGRESQTNSFSLPFSFEAFYTPVHVLLLL